MKKWGVPASFTFATRSHVELMTKLGMADFERGAKVAGFRGYFLKGDGALLSYALLRGRCRFCRTRISPEYPLVEALAGLLAAQCYRLFPDDAFFFSLSLLTWMALLFIAVYDIRHKIIPDQSSLFLGALTLLSLFVHGAGLAWFLAGPLLALPLLALSFFSRGRAMGWGDSKLMVGIGWLLGPLLGFSALLFSFWIGLAVSLVLLLVPLSSRGERLTMKSEIPYAPFLIAGAVLAYFTSAADFVARLLFF